jgi:hypothetical protein
MVKYKILNDFEPFCLMEEHFFGSIVKRYTKGFFTSLRYVKVEWMAKRHQSGHS